MFSAVALVSFMGFFSNSVPENRNILEKDVHHEHCKSVRKDLCESNRKRAYKQGCINKNELKVAEQKDLVIVCEEDQIMLICACSCLDPSSLVRVWDKQEEVWKDVAIETLEKNPSAYEVMAGSMEKGEIQVSKADFEVLTCAPKPLLEIQFSNQTKVLVSVDHPFQTAFGKTIRADDLDVGDKIPTEKATLLIQQIIKKAPNSKGVMNILIKGTDKQRLILANGVWSGDAKMQESMP